MTVRKIQAGRIITVTSTEYVGELGTIFYEETLGDLRLSDGVTPGGTPIGGGGGGGNGYTGSQGIQGYTGSRGLQGITGYTGSRGFTGSQGVTGYTGSEGVIGYTGSQGIIGYTGSQGDQGYTGSQGDQGYTGSEGAAGYTGSQGGEGYTGSQGYTGSIGYTGSAVIGLYSDATSTVYLSAGFDFVPDTNGTQSLGSFEKPFKDLYVSTGSIYIGGAIIQADADGEVLIQSVSTQTGVANWNSLRAKNLIIGTQEIPAYAMAENLTGILFPDGKFQPTAAPRMYTNADAANGFTISDLYPGDFYYDDVTESIYITIDTGLGYYDLLDLTIRA